MNAIETPYRGATFRSRLEARWAAMFDLLGWDWVYEPWDGNRYIPDFVLLGRRPVLVEVKPAVSLTELARYGERVEGGIRGHWDGDYLLVGATPALPGVPSGMDGPVIGWLGESTLHPAEPLDGEVDWLAAAGVWVGCIPCGATSQHDFRFIHSEQSYVCRSCGHYDGDGHLDPAIHPDRLTDLWNQAHQVTRWKGAA